jgi:amino acid adenylation domain-containing protein
MFPSSNIPPSKDNATAKTNQNGETSFMTLAPEQAAVGEKSCHTSERFVEFPEKDLEKSLSERFEKIVCNHPNCLAIKTHGRSATYADLNRVANRIAHGITEQHGSKKEPIGFLFEDIIDGVAASLAALKIGKPYVALDPSWPLERLSGVLADSKAALVLTCNQQLEIAQKLSHPRLRWFNTSEIGNSFSADNPEVPISPDDKTAITYTSGSTGEPKGVVETNRSRLHNTMTAVNQFRICPTDRLSLVHSIYFGAGQDQTFRSLLTGASLFPFDVRSFTLEQMIEWIRTEEITILYLPVALFRQLAGYSPDLQMLGSVRIVHISGAPVSRSDFELYRTKFPQKTHFAFHMGSTEAHVICSGIVDRTLIFPEEGTLAGYPIPDKEIRIIDDDGHDVAFGEVGEIAVKSRYLSSGYWGKADLTETKFLRNPARSDTSIYLTGDLGKVRPDGFVVHLGRKDFLVKIRGYRVELGEVERLLLTHPEVEAAAVVAWDREDGEKYLAAYFVPRKNFAPKGEALRVFLTEQLPDYMIPSAFMSIDSIPLTNGKLDRKQLPEPDGKRPELSTPYSPPRNELEERLARIWSEILSVERVGVNDIFLELGGDSLQATRIVSRVGEICSTDVLLRSLLKSATVAQMASLIAENQAEAVLGNIEDLSEAQARRLIELRAGHGDPDAPISIDHRKFWDRIAPEYTTAFSDIPEVAEYVGQTESDHMFRVLKADPELEVLDLGCGFGRWAVEFGKRCHRVVAVDFSPKMIERAHDFSRARGLTNIQHHVSPIQDFSSSDRFDIVLLSGVLVSIDDSQLLDTLENARQQLKPGGRIVVREIVAINNRHTLSSRIPNDPQSQHYSFYRRTNDYVQAFEKAGMRLAYANDMSPMDFIGPLYRRLSPRSSFAPVLRKILSLGLSVQVLFNPFLLRHKWIYRSLRDRLYQRQTVLLIFNQEAQQT